MNAEYFQRKDTADITICIGSAWLCLWEFYLQVYCCKRLNFSLQSIIIDHVKQRQGYEIVKKLQTLKYLGSYLIEDGKFDTGPNTHWISEGSILKVKQDAEKMKKKILLDYNVITM